MASKRRLRRQREKAAQKAMSNRAERFRKRLYRAQGGRCYLCGRMMPPVGELCHPQKRITTDHIRPKGDGGAIRGGSGNIALAHWLCNHKKADRLPTACEVLFGQIVKDIMKTPPTMRKKRFVKPFEMYGR